MRTILLAALVTLSCASLRADFSYQESSKMTGGTLYNLLRVGGPFTRKAREAQISTVAVQGNRMVRTDKDSVNIIDLDKETITDIDIPKKQYTVVTFAQMKAAMEKALADAQKEKEKAKEKSKGKAEESKAEVNFKVTAKATGATKDIEGLTAKEMLVTMEAQVKDKESGATGAMNVVSDGWMANVPGYNEVKAFHLKMAQKMGTLFDPAQAEMAIAQPEMVRGMAEASKEMAKVDGVPIRTVVKMGTGPTEELTKMGSDSEKPEEKGKTGKAVASAAASSAVGRITGIGGFGRKKEPEKPKEEEKAAPSSEAVLFTEMTMEMTQFSTAGIDASKFAVPANFKLVDSDVVKQLNKK